MEDAWQSSKLLQEGSARTLDVHHNCHSQQTLLRRVLELARRFITAPRASKVVPVAALQLCIWQEMRKLERKLYSVAIPMNTTIECASTAKHRDKHSWSRRGKGNIFMAPTIQSLTYNAVQRTDVLADATKVASRCTPSPPHTFRGTKRQEGCLLL